MEGDHILLENGHVVYAVGTDGLNKAFVNKRTGRDHLDSADSVPFMAIEKDGQWHGATGPQGDERPVLIAHADRRVGLDGEKVAVIACPTKSLLDIIEQIEIENGLPHPTIDGVWARRSPELMKSILYAEVSEETADDVIAYAKTGSLHVNRPHWCSSNGSFLINRKNFSNGETGLLTVSRKFHAAGLKFGLHNWEVVGHKHDPLVKPVPAKGFLMYPDRQRILAQTSGRRTVSFLRRPRRAVSWNKGINPGITDATGGSAMRSSFTVVCRRPSPMALRTAGAVRTGPWLLLTPRVRRSTTSPSSIGPTTCQTCKVICSTASFAPKRQS